MKKPQDDTPAVDLSQAVQLGAKLERVVILSGTHERKFVAHLIATQAANSGGSWAQDHLDFEVQERTHAIYKLFDVQRRMMLPAGSLDEIQDRPLPEMGGKTPRQAYALVKQFLRDNCGRDCIAQWLIARVDLFLPRHPEIKNLLVCDVDCVEDAQAIVNKYGRDVVTHVVVGRRPTFQVDCARTATVDPTDSESGTLSNLKKAVPFLFLEIVQ